MNIWNLDVNIFRQEECKTCFSSAARSGFRRPRSRSDAGAKELVKAAMLNCSQQYLSPKYDNCTAAMADNDADKSQVFGCYIRVLVGDTVLIIIHQRSDFMGEKG